MKNQFAKMYDLENGQVVAYKAYDDDEKEAPYVIKAMSEVEGVLMTATFGYATEADRDKGFVKFSKQNAKQVLSIAFKGVEGIT